MGWWFRPRRVPTHGERDDTDRRRHQIARVGRRSFQVCRFETNWFVHACRTAIHQAPTQNRWLGYVNWRDYQNRLIKLPACCREHRPHFDLE